MPWKVLTPATVGELAKSALTPAAGDKARRLLLDYAVTYSVRPYLEALRGFGFRAVDRLDAAKNDALQRYSVDLREFGQRELRRKMDQYGIDFRNPLNQTPLMVATQMGLAPLVGELVRDGAGTERCDNWGRNALQLALRAAYQDPQYARRTLGTLYPLLAPPSLRVRVGGRLQKIDNHQAEFFILQSMVAMQESMLRGKIDHKYPAFETADFVEALTQFPDHVIPPWRKQRSAITAALCNHEVFRERPHNRRLFVRLVRGRYILNPCMEFDLDGTWVGVPALFHFDVLAQEADPWMQRFLQDIRDAEKQVAAYLQREQGGGAEAAPAAAAEGAPPLPPGGGLPPPPTPRVGPRDHLLRPVFKRFDPSRREQDERVGGRAGAAARAQKAPRILEEMKIGTSRNAPCPCGSGRKYKRCCGMMGLE